MSRLPPKIQSPTKTEIQELAEKFYLTLDEDELEDFRELIEIRLNACEQLESFTESRPGIEYTDRDPGNRVGEDEDPLNAIVTRCRVKGAAEGPLTGYEVGIKDNIAVAGVEMTCASKVLESYVPISDAAVVERLLDAGASITAKTNMDEMAVSGSGELSATGPIFNPRDENHLAGGSSGGSAVAVVNGDVDVAIGTDQAGSVRTPAAWCGCVGHKPTHGLVSFRGAATLGPSFDHIGPMGTSVEDCARVLDSIAGFDHLDPRQTRLPEDTTDGFVEALSADLSGLNVGLVEEAFGFEHSEEGVDSAVRDAAEDFTDLGADVHEVSIPWHLDGYYVWMGVANEEIAAMWDADGTGYFVDGFYDTHFAQAFGNARRARADDFAQTVKVKAIVGRYLKENYFGYYHGKANNLRGDLTEAYDDVLETMDLLLMPTTPMTAFEYKPDIESRAELDYRVLGMDGRTRNTMPFDMTGHPAITVPCGTVGDLPVGLMLIGRHFEDDIVLRAAHAFEQAIDWQAR